jgi:hypothetical protein
VAAAAAGNVAGFGVGGALAGAVKQLGVAAVAATAGSSDAVAKSAVTGAIVGGEGAKEVASEVASKGVEHAAEKIMDKKNDWEKASSAKVQSMRIIMRSLVDDDGPYESDLPVKVLARLIFEIVVKVVAITIGACALLVLIVHFSLGKKSPGIISITETSTQFWIPLIVILCIALPAVFAVRIIWLAYRQASGMGLSLARYFEMPQEERERLVREYRKEDKAS